MQSKTEVLRMPLSLGAGITGLFLLLTTTSYWETKSETFTFLLFFIGIILVAIASLGRMWCSLYIAGYKDEKLITSGPYSLCRNPLYFFSMLGIIGVGFSTETLTFPFILLFLFALYYPVVIHHEERRLEQFFGPTFIEYKQRVPSFFPKLSLLEEPRQYVVNPKVYRRHIYNALWFIWVVGFIEVIEGLREIGLLGSLWALY